jgi:hypothetical protein
MVAPTLNGSWHEKGNKQVNEVATPKKDLVVHLEQKQLKDNGPQKVQKEEMVYPEQPKRLSSAQTFPEKVCSFVLSLVSLPY